ncbi:response regulator transcription factor [Vagococcus intermedius]|uniref:Response regulator transcription factor n=1 Tax=Vagococcus intermedius TaxID=2991418 RepID=A0AAF0CWE5_9ENTE|nr:response regulator transcription factor [Vagococcus intermedius]WEG74260.1 response regulator transcription factor [Vagococcus intermedius]WEG76342.1 response regulator transcription factor [Vagococcus intermedius]
MASPVILILDSNQRTGFLLKDELETAGMAVKVTTSYFDGLFEFKHKKIDLVITDISLGCEADFTSLKEIKRLSNIPVIVLSHLSDAKLAIQAFELGADDYLTRPFSSREVSLRTSRLLRYYYQESPLLLSKETYCSKVGLVIDFKERTVFIDRKKIALTHLEYGILTYLVKNEARIVSREELLKEVWGYSYLGKERNVDVAIRKLRNKLLIFSPRVSKCIETKWQKGYRFNAH